MIDLPQAIQTHRIIFDMMTKYHNRPRFWLFNFNEDEKQNKTKQNKTKQNKTKQNKTKQNKTKQNKAKQKQRKQTKKKKKKKKKKPVLQNIDQASSTHSSHEKHFFSKYIHNQSFLVI